MIAELRVTGSEILAQLETLGLLGPKQVQALSGRPELADREQLLAKLSHLGWLTAYQLKKIEESKAEELALGSFLLLEPLGQGGMSQLFNARLRGTKDLVTLKTVPSGDLALAERFLHEIQAVPRVDHP